MKAPGYAGGWLLLCLPHKYALHLVAKFEKLLVAKEGYHEEEIHCSAVG